MYKPVKVLVDLLASSRNCALLLAAFIVMFSWMIMPDLPYSAADFSAHLRGVPSLDMKIGYSPDQAYQMLGDYGADGRVYYVQKLLINDIAFPIVYSLFYASALAFLLKRLTGEGSLLRYLALLPLAGGIGDLLENTGILAMLLSYPARLDWVATATGLVTTGKLAVNMTAMALIVVCLALAAYVWLMSRVRRRIPT